LRFPMMTALGSFLDQQPGIKLETAITNSPSAIANEGLDVVLHIGPLADSSLRARPLGWTRSLVCASPAYLAAWGEPRHPDELSGHRAVIYARRDEEPNTRWAFARGGDSCEVDVPVRLISRDGVGLIEAALGGCGVARPFDLAVGQWLATGQLVELLRDWSAERQPVTAVLPAQGRSTAKTRLFLDYVESLMPSGTRS
jgi:DNA-binding transcriptional LysR family regulator